MNKVLKNQKKSAVGKFRQFLSIAGQQNVIERIILTNRGVQAKADIIPTVVVEGSRMDLANGLTGMRMHEIEERKKQKDSREVEQPLLTLIMIKNDKLLPISSLISRSIDNVYQKKVVERNALYSSILENACSIQFDIGYGDEINQETISANKAKSVIS